MEKLEQKAETFYNRLNKEESNMVQGVVKHIKACMPSYMESRDYIPKREEANKFLIAGVGGILRYPNPELAQDIDLAVVGLKYTNRLHDYISHSFEDVVEFTETITNYIEKLISDLGLESKGIEFDYGSGPFRGFDDEYELSDDKGNISSIKSKLESFSLWGSKGLQVCFPNMRPIDIQFIFNQTPDEWKSNQKQLPESRGQLSSEKGKSKNFPYAIL